MECAHSYFLSAWLVFEHFTVFYNSGGFLGARRNVLLGPASDISDFERSFGGRRRYQDKTNNDDGKPWCTPATEPQQAGLDLQLSGEFGRVGGRGVSRSTRLNVAKVVNHP